MYILYGVTFVCPPEASNIPGDHEQATLDATFAKCAHCNHEPRWGTENDCANPLSFPNLVIECAKMCVKLCHVCSCFSACPFKIQYV